MTREEFLKAREKLGKTQVEMARLLGCSVKSIRSFEQGLRRVPVHVERQVLFLIASLVSDLQPRTVCWDEHACPLDRRRHCPAWEFQLGHLCWFVNGTYCRGEPQTGWKEKAKLCRECETFQKVFRDILELTG